MVTGGDGKEKLYGVVLDAGRTKGSIERFNLRSGDTYRVVVEVTIMTLKQIEYYGVQ